MAKSRPLPEHGPLALLAAILAGSPSPPEAAACRSNPVPFEPPDLSESPADHDYRHRTAVAICEACPVLAECRTWAETQRADGMVRGGIRPTVVGRGRPKKKTTTTKGAA